MSKIKALKFYWPVLRGLDHKHAQQAYILFPHQKEVKLLVLNNPKLEVYPMEANQNLNFSWKCIEDISAGKAEDLKETKDGEVP